MSKTKKGNIKTCKAKDESCYYCNNNLVCFVRAVNVKEILGIRKCNYKNCISRSHKLY